LKSKGWTSLRGKKVGSSEEFAALARIWRNPSFETFRVVYLKGGEILAHEGVTARLPTQSVIFRHAATERAPAHVQAGRLDRAVQVREIYETRRRADRLGADEIILLHNHPSGSVHPSTEDLRATAMLAKL